MRVRNCRAQYIPFKVPQKNIGQNRAQRATHGNSINLSKQFLIETELNILSTKAQKGREIIGRDRHVDIELRNEGLNDVNRLLQGHVGEETYYVKGTQKLIFQINISYFLDKLKGILDKKSAQMLGNRDKTRRQPLSELMVKN